MLINEVRRQDAQLASMIEEEVASIVEVPTRSIAERVLDRLWSMMEEDDAWARLVLRASAREGLRLRIKKRMKRDRGTVHSKRHQSFSLPAYVAVLVSEEGKSPAFQLRLWWSLTWNDFFAMSDERFDHAKVINHENMIFAGVRSLYKRYPNTETVAEAFVLAGLNPREFSLEALAG